MKIKVVARSFFEARTGTRRESALISRYRIISINTPSMKEKPPFSKEYLKLPNLLILHFEDTESDDGGITDSDAMAAISFAVTDDLRPIIIHCTAGQSRSGAFGKVLNWYFNKHIAKNKFEFDEFLNSHRDITPNKRVKHKLMEAMAKKGLIK